MSTPDSKSFESSLPLNAEECLALDTALEIELTARKLTRTLMETISQRDLIDQRSFLYQIIDINPHFIFVKNRSGEFTLVNRAVANAYGCSISELLGKRDSDFNDNPEEVARFKSDDNEVMETLQEKFIAEESLTDAQGNIRWLQTVKRPVIDPDGVARHVLGVATDITERKLAQEKEKQFAEHLLHTQKLEGLGLLAGGIAHDFNNLLASITGNVELALRDLDAGASSLTSERLSQIQRVSACAADLVQQLLAYAGKGEVHAQVLDLRQLVTETIELVSVGQYRRSHLSTLVESEPLPVRADGVQIRQVVMNLLTNAFDAMASRSGNITVEVNRRNWTADRSSNFVVTPDQPQESYAQICITDVGSGMSRETLGKIFDPFFTTKSAGRGLGLSALIGIVRAHQGAVSVTSTEGEGTRFQVLLPLAEGMRESAKPDQQTVTTRRQHGKILIVDDEPLIREVAADALKHEGFEIVEAENGAIACQLIQNSSNIVSLILMDLTMPQMTGVEALAEIRKTSPNLPVILSSGFSDSQAFHTDRFTSFIHKPYRLKDLVDLIYRQLDQAHSK